MISYLSKGAINITDTEFVSPYDRKLIMDSIVKLREQELKAQEEAMRG